MSAPCHIFRAPIHEAVRVVDDTHEPPMVFELAPRQLVRCGRRNRRRWAARCVAQAYYDGIRFWCRDNAACKKGEG